MHWCPDLAIRPQTERCWGTMGESGRRTAPLPEGCGRTTAGCHRVSGAGRTASLTLARWRWMRGTGISETRSRRRRRRPTAEELATLAAEHLLFRGKPPGLLARGVSNPCCRPRWTVRTARLCRSGLCDPVATTTRQRAASQSPPSSRTHETRSRRSSPRRGCVGRQWPERTRTNDLPRDSARE